jgi:hypothetical protein
MEDTMTEVLTQPVAIDLARHDHRSPLPNPVAGGVFEVEGSVKAAVVAALVVRYYA